jgi:DNA modification methylase
VIDPRSPDPRPVRLEWPGKPDLEPVEARLVPTDLVIPTSSDGAVPAQPGRLVLGDNLAALWALLPDYENRLDLIYADPPFLSGKTYPARIGRGEDSRRPADWLLDEGYADHWPGGAEYLDMLYLRLKLMHRLLAETGTLYLHLDWHASAYARLLLDEIFGRERLLNEIAWIYHGPSPVRRAFNRKHDTLLVYTKGSRYTFNADAVRMPYNESTVRTFASSPRAGFGKVPDLARGKVPEDWWYFPVVARLHTERTGYPTQKPEALLERVIRASSNPGGLVADFFCGSGTALAVAERLDRRWLGGDASARAVHTTRKRLIAGGARPFGIERVETTGLRAPDAQPARPTLQIERIVDGAVQEIRLAGYKPARPLPAQLGSFVEAVDYWEVDFAGTGSLFRSEWQAFRRNGQQTLELSVRCPAEPGRRVRVRAVDIFGDVAENEIYS